MATKVLIEDFQKEKAIELSDGAQFILPERTAEMYEKIVALEEKRKDLSEYDYCKAVIETLFGEEGFNHIAPEGKKTNLDYLEKVQLVSLNLFMAEKVEAEKLEIQKRVNTLSPITDQIKALNPVLSEVK